VSALNAAVAAANGANFWSASDRVIDMHQLVSLQAWDIALGNERTYPYRAKDYYLYRDPGDSRFDVVPWGADQAFDDGFDWDRPQGLLGEKCEADATCMSELTTATSDAVDYFETLDMETMADTIFEVSDASLTADTKRGTSASSVRAARSRLAAQMAWWPDQVRADMGL
jgi:spore coat protein CotH